MNREMKGLFFIGNLRRLLLIGGRHWWNGFVRDITAKLEGTWLIRSKQ